MAPRPVGPSALPAPIPGTTGLEAAMATVGDRWTLVVIHALLAGPRRFSDLQGAIPRVAPNVLTSRLRTLEEGGLIVGVRYSDRPPRSEYRVTEAGRSSPVHCVC